MKKASVYIDIKTLIFSNKIFLKISQYNTKHTKNTRRGQSNLHSCQKIIWCQDRERRMISNLESHSKMKSQYYIMQRTNQQEQLYNHTKLQIYVSANT
jgi:hypothetical protein